MSRAVVMGVLVVALVSVFVPSFAQKSQAAPPGCDNHDLLGSYGFSASGTLSTGSPIAELGVLNFDGTGGVTGDVGIITSTTSGGIGIGTTYFVSVDCTGAILASGIIPFGGGIVIVASGSEIFFASSIDAPFGLGPQVVSGVMKKIK